MAASATSSDALPARMRVIEITRHGAPEVMAIGTRARPEPRPGEVLIRVEAAGVNRPDVGQRRGSYPPPPGASDLLGLEVAGTVVALGEGVTMWRIGDAVCALTPGGGYAEFCLTPAVQCLPLPRGLTMQQAASLPETFFTVWSNLFGPLGARSGDTILVQGGSSGIGVTAIQLAHALGHRVFATAGSDEKCAACAKLGARAINYRSEDFVQVIRDETGGRGVDVVLDMVGGDYVAREISLLAQDGRLIFLAFLGGAKAEVDLAQLVFRRALMTGSALRPRPIEFKGAVARDLEARVWPLIERGEVVPVIDSVFALADARLAHERMESSQHIGKIVLDCRS